LFQEVDPSTETNSHEQTKATELTHSYLLTTLWHKNFYYKDIYFAFMGVVFGLCHHNVSKAHAAVTYRVKRMGLGNGFTYKQGSSETLVSYHITTWCHNPEDHDMNLQSRDVSQPLSSSFSASAYDEPVFPLCSSFPLNH